MVESASASAHLNAAAEHSAWRWSFIAHGAQQSDYIVPQVAAHRVLRRPRRKARTVGSARDRLLQDSIGEDLHLVKASPSLEFWPDTKPEIFKVTLSDATAHTLMIVECGDTIKEPWLEQLSATDVADVHDAIRELQIVRRMYEAVPPAVLGSFTDDYPAQASPTNDELQSAQTSLGHILHSMCPEMKIASSMLHLWQQSINLQLRLVQLGLSCHPGFAMAKHGHDINASGAISSSKLAGPGFTSPMVLQSTTPGLMATQPRYPGAANAGEEDTDADRYRTCAGPGQCRACESNCTLM